MGEAPIRTEAPCPEWLAALHATCFPTTPRAWSAPEFAALLRDPACFCLSTPHAFLLGRVAADEAELLTLATDPAKRRNGHGAALCDTFVTTARNRGAQTGFLEVAHDNAPARALYARKGWREVGRRPRYYAPDRDALVLSRDLCAPECHRK